MKTPARPRSSTLFARSMSVCGGVSGIAEKERAILVLAAAIIPSFLFSLDSAALRLGSGCAAALRAPFGPQFEKQPTEGKVSSRWFGVKRAAARQIDGNREALRLTWSPAVQPLEPGEIAAKKSLMRL